MTFNSTIKVNFTTFQTNLYFTSSQSIPIELVFIKNKILKFIDENYTTGNSKNILSYIKLSESPNKDGKYEVSCNSDIYVKNARFSGNNDIEPIGFDSL